MSRRFAVLALAALIALAACGPEEIPTVVSLDALASEQAATAVAIASPTSAVPTLPPTWTPSPIPTPTLATPSPTPQSEAELSADRLVFVGGGALYTVAPDGSGLAALTEARDVRDLALSPGGRQVAYVGIGLGSGREVFVMNLDSGVIQQATSLGYADAVDPSWHPNGQFLIFAASQYEGGQRDLYTVRPDGRDLVRRSQFAVTGAPGADADEIPPLTEPIFTPDGAGVVFAMPDLQLLDLGTGELTLLTIGTGVSNDTSPTLRPGASGELVYIRPRQQVDGRPSGPLHVVSLLDFTALTVPPVFMESYTEMFRWSADGSWMVFTGGSRVYLLDSTTQSARTLTDTEYARPLVAISPDGERVAYTWGDGARLSVFARGDRSGREIVHLPGQTITELVWASGG